VVSNDAVIPVVGKYPRAQKQPGWLIAIGFVAFVFAFFVVLGRHVVYAVAGVVQRRLKQFGVDEIRSGRSASERVRHPAGIRTSGPRIEGCAWFGRGVEANRDHEVGDVPAVRPIAIQDVELAPEEG
jgi:hypothetical protein